MKYSFKNLALSGGGVWGIAYLGMLAELEQAGALPQIQRVIGSSAGAISSMLISFGLSAAQTKDLADSLDYRKIPQKVASALPSNLDAAFNAFKPFAPKANLEDFVCLLRLFNKKGWYSSDYFYHWLKDIAASQFKDGRQDKKYTFADFANPALHKNERPFRELFVTGCYAPAQKSMVFSAELTPDVEVAEAVRISMSIPFFFEAQNFTYPGQEAGVFVDGGTMWNYPINFFDDKYSSETVFGARFTHQSCQKSDRNLIEHIADISHCVMAVQTQNYDQSRQDQGRSINIDTGQVKATDFNIQPNDPVYQQLYQAGAIATRAFLSRCEQ
ncbi:patatin-like phospholipase family protein [Chromobacterium sp. IRSSSOUMB001]|uniref:patatin-like phospholipase family protein n=1 Tax=Chromobacterium sp. IRSSSOUMB001 TaxID=2927123 RepID=UPI0020BD8433|nr:patatin-like phospholipase family protein [Chromobacterium sp. IRSSSOUMB001]